MHSELNDLAGRLAALAGFEPPADGWRAVLAARDAREARLDRRWPLALAAAALVATVGIAARLQGARDALGAGPEGASPARPPVAAEMRAENERLPVADEHVHRTPSILHHAGTHQFVQVRDQLIGSMILDEEDRFVLVSGRGGDCQVWNYR